VAHLFYYGGTRFIGFRAIKFEILTAVVELSCSPATAAAAAEVRAYCLGPRSVMCAPPNFSRGIKITQRRTCRQSLSGLQGSLPVPGPARFPVVRVAKANFQNYKIKNNILKKKKKKNKQKKIRSRTTKNRREPLHIRVYCGTRYIHIILLYTWWIVIICRLEPGKLNVVVIVYTGRSVQKIRYHHTAYTAARLI
jgi:hypothetical protein